MVGLSVRGIHPFHKCYTCIGYKIASTVLIKLDNTETGIGIHNTTNTGPTVLQSVRAGRLLAVNGGNMEHQKSFENEKYP